MPPHRYSADDPIGTVYVDLNPLLTRAEAGSTEKLVIHGWFPIYDTLKGVRGELNVRRDVGFGGGSGGVVCVAVGECTLCVVW